MSQHYLARTTTITINGSKMACMRIDYSASAREWKSDFSSLH